jgi:hypothetical protein
MHLTLTTETVIFFFPEVDKILKLLSEDLARILLPSLSL